MKIHFKCRQHRLTGEILADLRSGLLPANKMILLEPQEGEAAVRAFFQKKYKHDEKTREESYLDCEMTKWYKRRTLRQHRLHFAICQRIAENPEVGSTVGMIHDGIKAIAYPQVWDEVTERLVAKEGRDLSTVEYSKIVEETMLKAFETGTDIRDIWILFTHWRYAQKTDPLEGSYADWADYLRLHPCCEACGKYLVWTDEEGQDRHAGHGAHIVSRGAGGSDDDWNRFVLCTRCHIELQHQKGWDDLLSLYDHLSYKVKRARQRIA